MQKRCSCGHENVEISYMSTAMPPNVQTLLGCLIIKTSIVISNTDRVDSCQAEGISPSDAGVSHIRHEIFIRNTLTVRSVTLVNTL